MVSEHFNENLHFFWVSEKKLWILVWVFGARGEAEKKKKVTDIWDGGAAASDPAVHLEMLPDGGAHLDLAAPPSALDLLRMTSADQSGRPAALCTSFYGVHE